jgi:glucosamine--fructose-6-phosphate aminotransferase (isomerizing)
MFKDQKHIFLLGSGLGEVISKEGSLKLKELTYKHCQAFSFENMSNGYYSFA